MFFGCKLGGGNVLTRVEKSIVINASPEEIWLMIQLDRTPEWYVEWKKVKWISEDKNEVGNPVKKEFIPPALITPLYEEKNEGS
jgi:hypothetical protein